MSATIRRVPRPRGSLTDQEIEAAAGLRLAVDEAQRRYRGYCLLLLANGRSFSEVSKATGLSTNTLQRWKREAT